MQILDLLGMYFDAVVVEVEKSLLFFRLALAILWRTNKKCLATPRAEKKGGFTFCFSGEL
jgi:hypothetical protein